MKYVLLAVAVLLSACDNAPTPKIDEPQREALDKAKAVEQTVQKEAEASRQAIENATE